MDRDHAISRSQARSGTVSVCDECGSLDRRSCGSFRHSCGSRWPRRRWSRSFAASSAPVLAAPVDKRELEARADFAAGRYQKAVDTFAQLFADTGDPLYLRNIGRCYQKMKRAQEATDSFQEYLLKSKNLSKSERQEIEGYIKEMQALKASEAPPPPPPVVTPPPRRSRLPRHAGCRPPPPPAALPPRHRSRRCRRARRRRGE